MSENFSITNFIPKCSTFLPEEICSKPRTKDYFTGIALIGALCGIYSTSKRSLAGRVTQQPDLPKGSQVARPRDLSNSMISTERGEEYPQGIAAASKFIRHPNQQIREEGLKLFETLFRKGEGYQEAIQAATSSTQSADVDVHKSGLKLFSLLVQHQQGYVPAVKAVQTAKRNLDLFMDQSVLNLKKHLAEAESELSKNGKAEEVLVGKAIDYIDSPGLEEYGVFILQELIEKGQGVAEAINELHNPNLSQETKDQLSRLLVRFNKYPYPIPLSSPLKNEERRRDLVSHKLAMFTPEGPEKRDFPEITSKIMGYLYPSHFDHLIQD